MAKKQDEQKTKEQQPAEETKPVTDEQLPEQEPETEAAPPPDVSKRHVRARRRERRGWPPWQRPES